MIATLHAMTSGECRWVGRYDIHVYCWAPLNRPAVFKVWTADSVGSPWDDAGWVTASVAVRQIESILAKEPRHVA